MKYERWNIAPAPDGAAQALMEDGYPYLLSLVLASRGVTANAVAPGFIDTDMTAAMSEAAKAATLASIPLGKLGKPEDVAAAVAFLASEEAGYITGQVLAVDGGMAM